MTLCRAILSTRVMPLDACSHRSARSPGAAPGALLRTVVSVALVGSASCFHVTSGRISRCTQSQIIHAARTLNVQAREGERQITNQPCRVLFKQVEVPAEHGETLRTALLKSGKVTPHNGKAQIINCRGLGTCGTCAVEIKGKVSPSTWNAKERLRLNFPPHSMPGNQKLRLACQVVVEGDLAVTKYDRFWGEGDEVTKDLSFSVPFGELEFLLDQNKK